MQQGKVSVPKLTGITLVYVLLNALGFFTQIEAVLFPVFALPFALYVAKNKPPAVVQVIFHLAMLMINYYITDGQLMAVLIYGVSVIGTTYVILFFYSQRLALPNFIAYVAISLCVITFIFFTLIKMNGIDFEQIYIGYLDRMKELFTESAKIMMNMREASGIVTDKAAFNEGQEFVLESLEQMKAYFASVVITLVVSFSALSVVIFNSSLRRKDKTLPSIRELIEFRLSKAAVVIFIISMVIVSMADPSQNAVVVLGLNLMNVFIWLFRVAGGLGLIGLLSRSAVNGPLKVIGYISIALAFGSFPFMCILIIFGCLDAFFNFRKVEIVV